MIDLQTIRKPSNTSDESSIVLSKLASIVNSDLYCSLIGDGSRSKSSANLKTLQIPETNKAWKATKPSIMKNKKEP